jgi:hypothetical protein
VSYANAKVSELIERLVVADRRCAGPAIAAGRLAEC